MSCSYANSVFWIFLALLLVGISTVKKFEIVISYDVKDISMFTYYMY